MDVRFRLFCSKNAASELFSKPSPRCTSDAINVSRRCNLEKRCPLTLLQYHPVFIPKTLTTLFLKDSVDNTDFHGFSFTGGKNLQNSLANDGKVDNLLCDRFISVNAASRCMNKDLGI
jgi:hypothetical protein